MEKTDFPVDLLGRVGEADIEYWHCGNKINVRARRGGEVIGEIMVVPEVYFYGLFGEKAVELAAELHRLRRFFSPSLPKEEEAEGEWEERLFLSENGLGMVFSPREQLLLPLRKEVVDRIEGGLRGWIEMINAANQCNAETFLVLEGGPAGPSFP